MIMIPVLLLNLPFACMPVLEKLLVILAVFFTISPARIISLRISRF